MIVRYSRKIVAAEHNALMTLTETATFSGPTNMVKNLAMSWNTGFPGGWPTSSLYDDAINSPQSQNEAVDSIVERYVNAAITKTTTDAILFQSLNFFLSILF